MLSESSCWVIPCIPDVMMVSKCERNNTDIRAPRFMNNLIGRNKLSALQPKARYMRIDCWGSPHEL